jgi:E3 ubiquitin-protein ligase TRIP12
VSKLKDKEGAEASGSGDVTAPAPTPAQPLPTNLPGFRKLTQLAIDPEDAVTLRSRVIRLNYLSAKDNDEANNVFATLRKLVERISKPKASEKDLTAALRDLATLFAVPHSSVSSFELLQSGVIDGLLSFATDKDRNGMYCLTFFRAFTNQRHSVYHPAARADARRVHYSAEGQEFGHE